MSSKHKTTDTVWSDTSKYEVREKNRTFFKNEYHVNKNGKVDSGTMRSRSEAVKLAKKKANK